MDTSIPHIKLDSFLKLRDIAQSGGEAKLLVAEGIVTVNGQTETRRGRKLRPGDVVLVNGRELSVSSDICRNR